MAWIRIGINLTGTVAALSTLMAAGTVWLVLTSPGSLAAAVDQGSITPVVRELADALVDAIRELLRYL